MPIRRVSFSPEQSRSHHEPDQQRPPAYLAPSQPAPPGQALPSAGAAAMATLSPASVARANDANALNAATYANPGSYTASGEPASSADGAEKLNVTA